MILASGARGREFDSRNTPFLFVYFYHIIIKMTFINFCFVLFQSQYEIFYTHYILFNYLYAIYFGV